MVRTGSEENRLILGPLWYWIIISIAVSPSFCLMVTEGEYNVAGMLPISSDLFG